MRHVMMGIKMTPMPVRTIARLLAAAMVEYAMIWRKMIRTQKSVMMVIRSRPMGVSTIVYRHVVEMEFIVKIVRMGSGVSRLVMTGINGKMMRAAPTVVSLAVVMGF